MKGDLTINQQDAYEIWGVSLGDESLSTLMTPPPIKERVSNNSPLENGVRYITLDNKIDERDLNIVIYLSASNKETFVKRYAAFCKDVLSTGNIDISTKWQDGVVYHCIYKSCSQFTEYGMHGGRGLAKFTLKLTEPDPTNRS